MNPYGPFESKRTSKQRRAPASPAELRAKRRLSAKTVVRKHLKRGQLPYELHEALELLLQDM